MNALDKINNALDKVDSALAQDLELMKKMPKGLLFIDIMITVVAFSWIISSSMPKKK